MDEFSDEISACISGERYGDPALDGDLRVVSITEISE